MTARSLVMETFAPHRGTAFAVRSPGVPPLDLSLAEVERLPAQPEGPRAEPFSLVFSGPPEPRLEQQIHRLAHAELGDLEIFLVPIGYGADGRLLYEAVFN